MSDTFGARSTLTVGGLDHEIFRPDRLEDDFRVSQLPYSIKVLLENLLRRSQNGRQLARNVRAPARRPEVAALRRDGRLAERCCVDAWSGAVVPKSGGCGQGLSSFYRQPVLTLALS